MEGSRVAERDRDEPADDVLASDESLEGLYARHIQDGVRLAYLLEGDRMRAEDLAQEAFIRCVGRFRHLRRPEAFHAYLRRAIVNLHTSSLRRRRLERAWLERERADASGRATTMPDVSARQDLWAALGTLPPRQRAALVLRYYEDLSERDAATVMGCSTAALKSLVSRGSATLRDRIGSEDR
jgi:RNA polymerase sigma-70 factor (sigma-E family)